VSGRESTVLLLRKLTPCDTTTAIVGLTALDAGFVLGELGYEFSNNQACSCTNTCEEPVILEMISLLSIMITCKLSLSRCYDSRSQKTE
jgi:hypothetical protein